MSSTTTALPDGYYIAQLRAEHLPWVQAIVAHTMSFDSPVWSRVDYPDGGPTQRAYDMYHAMETSSLQSIKSELSYGVFWAGHRPNSTGTLHWDFTNPHATRAQLLEQMDFPLVSIAMSKDVAESSSTTVNPLPSSTTITTHKPWAAIVDGHRDISDTLKALDPRRPSLYSPTAKGLVARRSGTHTRGDHANRGLAKALAHFIMHRVLCELGYQAILIHAGGEGLNRVWLNPPAGEGFRAEEVSKFDTKGYVREADGKRVFGDAEVVSKRIWVTWEGNN
ncbi:uncharacterized protein C8A04DRAFT_11935 [Dichotomopilus funicola]|uniref:Uncharacterized protein n=1 Tax=Dichotomopilus funicola TaxID=1934379 RepID=A0AAN6ZMI0_9PEZI|nr:hypothetical protein C8A04DRAFT_11935 [Dichotomopilus funicola]